MWGSFCAHLKFVHQKWQKSTFSYLIMLYIVGKLITYALIICGVVRWWPPQWGTFFAITSKWGDLHASHHFEAHTSKNDKNQLFHFITCYISLESWKFVLLESVIVFRVEGHFEPILKLAILIFKLKGHLKCISPCLLLMIFHRDSNVLKHIQIDWIQSNRFTDLWVMSPACFHCATLLSSQLGWKPSIWRQLS